MTGEPVDVHPGPDFWDELRSELSRTGVSSLERFTRTELPWLLDRFRFYWNELAPLIDDYPHRRFAEFESLDGYRFTADGWMRTSGLLELVDIQILTWDWPETTD